MKPRSIFDAGPVAGVTGFGFLIRNRARQAEASHPPLGPIVKVGNKHVHYHRQGKGPVVILIHGAGGNLRDFTFQLAAKLAETNDVIAIDRPGHGYTDTLHNMGESTAEQADLLHDTVVALGIRRAIICGYSLGGAVALAWGLQYPEFVAGLLLISAVTHPCPVSIGLLYQSAAHPLSGAFMVPALAAFTPNSLVRSTLQSVFQPKDVPEAYLNYIGAGLSLRAHSIRANARQVVNLRRHVVEMTPHYDRLKLPVEILHGTNDRSVYAEIHAERLTETLAQSVYTVLPGIGHSPHHHSHKEILAALARLNALHV